MATVEIPESPTIKGYSSNDQKASSPTKPFKKILGVKKMPSRKNVNNVPVASVKALTVDVTADSTMPAELLQRATAPETPRPSNTINSMLRTPSMRKGALNGKPTEITDIAQLNWNNLGHWNPDSNADLTTDTTKSIMSANFPPYGVSIECLRKFASNYQSTLRGMTTEQVCYNVIKPMTSKLKLSLAELVSKAGWKSESGLKLPYVANATVFLSHAWSSPFLEVLGALESFIVSADMQVNQIYIWMDVFCVNQHEFDANSTGNVSNWPQIVAKGIAGIGYTCMILSPWDAPPSQSSLARSWILWELLNSIQRDCKVAIHLLGPSSDTGVPFEDAMMSKLAAVREMLVAGIDIRTAQAASEKDKKFIDTAVDGAIGSTKANSVLQNHILKWLCDRAEAVAQRIAPEQRSLVPSMEYLAQVSQLLVAVGKVGEAEELLRDTLALYESQLKPLTTSSNRHDNGNNNMDNGEEGDFYASYSSSSSKKKATIDPEKLAGGLVLVKLLLAEARRLQDKFEEAKIYCGPMHFSAMFSLYPQRALLVHADILFETGNLKEAEGSLRLWLSLDDLTSVPTSLYVQRKLAMALWQLQGPSDEVESLFLGCLGKWEIFCQETGEQHRYMFSCFASFATYLRARGRLSDALQFARMALEGQLTVLGVEHVVTLQTMHNLAVLLIDNRACLQALEHVNLAVVGRRKLLGASHADTLESMRVLNSLTINTLKYGIQELAIANPLPS